MVILDVISICDGLSVELTEGKQYGLEVFGLRIWRGGVMAEERRFMSESGARIAILELGLKEKSTKV